jgi:hypothetical protein
MKNTKMLLAALAVALSLAACAGPSSSTPSPTASNPAPAAATVPSPVAANPNPASAPVAPVAQGALVDACKLLPQEAAEAVVGPLISVPKTSFGDQRSSCAYMGKNYTSVITLVIRSGVTNADFDTDFQASKGLSGVDPVTIDGLGDKAYWFGGTLNELNILKGGNWIMVLAMGVEGDLQSIDKGIAEKVLANM